MIHFDKLIPVYYIMSIPKYTRGRDKNSRAASLHNSSKIFSSVEIEHHPSSDTFPLMKARQVSNRKEDNNLQVCVQQFKAYAQMPLIYKIIKYTNNVMLILRIVLLI